MRFTAEDFMPEPKPEEPISYPERVARLVAARKWPDIAAQSGIQFAAHVALVRTAVHEVLAVVELLAEQDRQAERLSNERLRRMRARHEKAGQTYTVVAIDELLALRAARPVPEFTPEPGWLQRDVDKAAQRLKKLATAPFSVLRPTEIEIRQWIKRGPMRIKADALPGDDPDHPYNQALAQGVRPEDYGLERPEMPLHAVCPHCGR